jgi:putative ABC transport system permease protein
LGSMKKQLILQFFIESILLACMAFIVSVIAVYLLLPFFNELVNKNLSLNLSEPVISLGALAIIAFTGLVAGSYPALYLSSFNPVIVLKGTFLAGKKTVMPRHILVVAQFVISIFLISATVIIYRQINHVKDRDMGYDPDNLVMIPTTSNTQKNFTAIKEDLLQTGMISAVTRTSSPITEVWWKTPGPDWPGKPAQANMIFSGMSAEVDFTKTMGIRLLAGRDFSGLPSDSSVMLLNQAAVDAMALKDPVGMPVSYNGKKYTIAGVTSNVVMESPYKPVDPMMIINYPDYANSIGIRLKDKTQPKKALAAIEPVFKKYNPAFPFEYQFADQEYGKKFITEERISRITNIFAALAIFICCLGLAGLAAFSIEKRIREIGIRKVLGASARQILFLVSKEFLLLVMIAFLVATPLSWWLMHNWLRNYEYHVGISIWLFVVVGISVLLLSLTVVGLNTLKSILANPVRALRSE